MEKKITLTKKDYKQLQKYCELNKLNEDDFVKSAFDKGFKIEMYGLLNGSEGEIDSKVIEKEVTKFVEIIKEVEVPKIEYVEVVKEVFVEKPIEVVVEKIIQDNSKIKEIESFFEKEKQTLQKKINELGEGKVIEIIKEVPKEVIIEVEKIVEVPVVNKPEFEKMKGLESTLQKLKTENIEKDKKIKNLESIIDELKKMTPSQAIYLRGSNLRDKLF